VQQDCSANRVSLTSDVIRGAWSELLSRYQWNVFSTLTWKSPAGLEKVCRDSRIWLFDCSGDAAAAVGLARWEGPKGRRRLKGWWANTRRRNHHQVISVLAVEPHQSGRLHAHMLIRWPECFGWVAQVPMRELWDERHGRAHLETPRGQDNVRNYVSKYVCKERGELFISDSFQAAKMLVNT